ncbi:sensor histidine kinase [Spirosoma pollinicola]|uniref:histidine kinase n=1 Tax=Spirosoma pollinicola TaxID=2057025 RepID=A0A2K8YY01_9BACT|nr:HAMP domain-containing sensor histidine kinase [Spirosoma pollinicola]AUD02516.1 two-component sensor histidine kinase [Spirosoma pollinicola]
MLHRYRSSAFPLFTFALLLVFIAGLLLRNWLSAPETDSFVSPSLLWLALFGLAIVLQMVIGYVLWRVLRQRQRSVVQTEVLHSIVHEFQTPITAIRMAVDILDSPIARNQPERTEKYVRIIREETERLQHHVETMLTLARADRNTLILNTEPVYVHQLLHSVAERHGEYLTVKLPNTDTYILADRLHLTNVLYNLLDNAVKYSSHEPRITMQARKDTDGLTISICDEGVGIPPKLISQIFQPFFRVHDRNQPSVKGFGLGLSYVQRIIQSHGWTIWVKSEQGKGSEFIIQIPPSSILPPLPKDMPA